MTFDYGQAAIAAFSEAAAGIQGAELKFDEDSAREVVRVLDVLINSLTTASEHLRSAANGQGFGGFASGQEMRDGFADKAVAGKQLVEQLIIGVMNLQEGFLRAAQLLPEADQLNAAALQRVAATVAGTAS